MAKTKVEIPQSATELTPKYFTSAVGPKYGNGKVTAVETEVVGEGIGFMGELHRCRLTWVDASGDAPASVIAKLPSQHDKNRSLGEALQVYEREIRVYSELREGFGLPMPEYIHSTMDPHPAPWLEKVVIFLFEKLPIAAVGWLLTRLIKVSGKQRRRYILIMEDIHDARPPSQVVGGTLEDALQGLEVLARFHATNWMDQAKIDSQPILWDVDRTPKVIQASYRRNRDSFMEQYGDVL
ncbi:MAG: hypothetical protein ACI91O_000988, partial [Candidatus Poriferisodalaceae bacterium]